MLANLAEARPEAISLAVAGLLEPDLTPPHRLMAPLAGPVPPAPAESLLAALASATDSDRVTPGLRRFLTDADRSGWRTALSEVSAWTPLGCDSVSGRARRGSARRSPTSATREAHSAKGDLLVTVRYTGDWRAADIDSYDF